MKHVVKPALSLFVVAALSAVSLGVVHEFMSGPIAENQRRTRERMLGEVLPAADEFVESDREAPQASDPRVRIARVFEGLRGGQRVGYAVEIVTGAGYGGEIALMVGVSSETGAISGMRVLRHSETPGFGAVITRESFFRRFEGLALAPLVVVSRAPAAANEFQAIASSTITTRAIVDAVNEAIEWYNRSGR